MLFAVAIFLFIYHLPKAVRFGIAEREANFSQERSDGENSRARAYCRYNQPRGSPLGNVAVF